MMNAPILKTLLLAISATGLGGFVAGSMQAGQRSADSPRSGEIVRKLPSGFHGETVQGNRYYYHHGVYYRPYSGGFIVVDAPRGFSESADRECTWAANAKRGETAPNGRL